MRLGRTLTALVAVAVLVPTGCSDGGPSDGEARLEVTGRALIERADGDAVEVDGQATLERGDRVELLEGVAALALSGGTRFELRAGHGDAAPSLLKMGEVPTLEAGDLLVSAPASTAIEAAGTVVHVAGGSAQVSRSLGVGVAAYDAEVEVDSAGQERVVPALRQMVVPALGRPPQAPRPLAYDSADPWDRRFLGSAVELGETLGSLAAGYTNNLRPGQATTPEFFRIVLPSLQDEPDFDGTLIDEARPAGETLVGAAITALGERGEFRERWSSVFEFREQGALWGLVALDQAVSGPPLLGSVQQAVSSSPLAFVEPSDPAPPPVPPPAPVEGPSTPDPTSPPSTAPTPTTAPAPPTTVAPPPQDELLTPPLEPVVPPLVDAVGGLLNGLLGILDTG